VHLTIQLQLVDDHGDLMSDKTILGLDKGTDQLGEIGLSLEEGKAILAGLQRPIIEAQVAGYLRQHGHCPHCQRRLWRKGLYGAFRVKSEGLIHLFFPLHLRIDGDDRDNDRRGARFLCASSRHKLVYGRPAWV
jgi:hypothetical protein